MSESVDAEEVRHVAELARVALDEEEVELFAGQFADILAYFDALDAPHDVAATIKGWPGVLDHGLFLDIATDVLVGAPDGQVRHRRRASS